MNIQPILNGILQNPVPCLIPIFAVLGILALVSGFTLRREGKVVNWAKTNGTLVDCGVVSRTTKGRVSNMTINETHIVTISYRYAVNKKQYEGNKFKVDTPFILVETRKEGERLAQKFKASPNVVVYYDPANPADCTLSPNQRENSTSSSNLNFGAGIVLIVLAVGMFFVYHPY